MKQTLLVAAIITVITGMNSCSLTYHSSTAKTRNIRQSSISETASISDLKVEEQKVTGTGTGKNVNDETVKNLAVYDALKKVNADVLVEPTYEIEKTGNITNVTVQGYPGYYKNFRRPTLQDSLIMGWKVITEAPSAVNNSTGNTTTTTITTNAPVNLSTAAAAPAAASNGAAPAKTFLQSAYSSFLNAPKAQASTSTLDASSLYDYQQEKKKGKALVGTGVAFLCAGAIIAGMSPFGVSVSYNNSYNGYYNTSNEVDNLSGFYSMIGIGTAMAVSGLVMIPIGARHLKKAKMIRNQSVANNVKLVVMPDVDLARGRYGGSLSLKF